MSLIVKSEGLTLYNYWIPPFELKAGKLIDLWIPGNSTENDYVGSKIEKQLIQLLTSRKHHPALCVEKPLQYVEHFRGDNFLRARFRPTTPKSYLKRYSALSGEDINQLLVNLQVTRNLPLNRYGGNTRKLLSLWASRSKSQNILFDCYGIDPQGIEVVRATIEQIVLEGGSAIELNMPDLHGRRKQSRLAEIVKIEAVRE